MRQIYISHARCDEAKAHALSAALENAGHTVWRHTRRELSGWGLATPKTHLADADDVIAIWSKGSVSDPEVCDVAAKGRATGRLTSVLADYVEPPVASGEIRVIDMATWAGDPTDRTARRLRDIFPVINAPEPVVIAAPAPKPVKRVKRAKSSGFSLPLWPFALTAATCLAAIGAVVA